MRKRIVLIFVLSFGLFLQAQTASKPGRQRRSERIGKLQSFYRTASPCRCFPEK